MKWKADKNENGSVNPYCVTSDCGNYRVTRNSHTSGDWQYASIFRKQIIGTSFSAEHEKKRCVEHNEGVSRA